MNSSIITKRKLKEMQELYEAQQRDIKRRLRAIQRGSNFGVSSVYDLDSYFPAELLDVLDKETGKIVYRDLGTGKVHTNYISHLYVEGIDL